ncbi:MAG: hypothetical protein JOZ52_02220 [Acidobacteria bacterium]|nr:hypothetical protein [Acidobacteriota bacterium]
MSIQAGLVERLGLACIIAAVLSGILQGVWEMSRPILTSDSTFAMASTAQRWGYGLLAVVKSAGFLAGLFGLYIAATRRGWLLKIFMGLAVMGGVFFAAVWLVMAANGRFTIVYVLGGMWYQMIAPVALGIAALYKRRAAWWIGVYAIIVGILNSQIFMLFGPMMALIVQGVIWLILGYAVYTLSRAPHLSEAEVK